MAARESRLNAEWTVTPAEHTVHGRTYDVVEFFPDEGSTGAIVARLHPSVRGIQGKEESLPVVRERALAMAASRELLAALEGLMEFVPHSGGLPDLRKAALAARAAIAKAAGK